MCVGRSCFAWASSAGRTFPRISLSLCMSPTRHLDLNPEYKIQEKNILHVLFMSACLCQLANSRCHANFLSFESEQELLSFLLGLRFIYKIPVSFQLKIQDLLFLLRPRHRLLLLCLSHLFSVCIEVLFTHPLLAYRT